jgi:hypothetical protein
MSERPAVTRMEKAVEGAVEAMGEKLDSQETENPDWRLLVSFEPEAIRAHYEGDDPDPTEGLTDENLREVGEYAINSDRLWGLFHDLLEEALFDLHGRGSR